MSGCNSSRRLWECLVMMHLQSQSAIRVRKVFEILSYILLQQLNNINKMKLFFPGVLLLASSHLASAQNNYVNQGIVDSINQANSTWTAINPKENPFHNWTNSDIMNMFGLKTQSKGSFFKTLFSKTSPKSKPKLQEYHQKLSATIPLSFDARNQWPACVHPVRTQGGCGSCWAFATAGFLEDRYCIASNGAITAQLSPQDMVTCDLGNGGCGGGFLTMAMEYLTSEGIVAETCLPYNGATNYCLYQCQTSSEAYTKYSCEIGSLSIPTSYDDIKTELMTNGPLAVGFTAYQDFLSYSNGIYQYTSGSVAGGHAVKLIGWDHDGNGNLFWICQNQWSPNWGISGFFNIYAEQVGIDSAAWGCTPNLSL